MTTSALPPVVDADTWQRQLDELRVREKAATRELDAIAAQRRRLPMVKMPDYSAQSLERSSHGFRGGLRVDLICHGDLGGGAGFARPRRGCTSRSTNRVAQVDRPS
jgi:hypothetical protein